MLVLSRKKNEAVIIGGCIKVVVVELRDLSVRIGVEAPREITVHRKEIADAIAADAATGGGKAQCQLPWLLDYAKTHEPCVPTDRAIDEARERRCFPCEHAERRGGG